MMVRPDHTNVIGTMHGGIVFTLADAAFGFAQAPRNEHIVSADAEIRFLAPAKAGQRLEAEAKEIWRTAPARADGCRGSPGRARDRAGARADAGVGGAAFYGVSRGAF